MQLPRGGTAVVSEVGENPREALHLILSVIFGSKISTVLKSISDGPTIWADFGQVKGQRLLNTSVN